MHRHLGTQCHDDVVRGCLLLFVKRLNLAALRLLRTLPSDTTFAPAAASCFRCARSAWRCAICCCRRSCAAAAASSAARLCCAAAISSLHNVIPSALHARPFTAGFMPAHTHHSSCSCSPGGRFSPRFMCTSSKITGSRDDGAPDAFGGQQAGRQHSERRLQALCG